MFNLNKILIRKLHRHPERFRQFSPYTFISYPFEKYYIDSFTLLIHYTNHLNYRGVVCNLKKITGISVIYSISIEAKVNQIVLFWLQYPNPRDLEGYSFRSCKEWTLGQGPISIFWNGDREKGNQKNNEALNEERGVRKRKKKVTVNWKSSWGQRPTR